MKRTLIHILTVCFCLVLLSGCGTDKEEKTKAPVSFADALGNEVSVDSSDKTAVLSGSLADAWVSAGGALFATTEDAKDLVEITEECVMLGMLKSPSVEKIIAEEIDFVILSAAISEHVDLAESFKSAGIKTAYFDVETFADYAEMMKVMTDVTGRKDLYKQNVEQIQGEIKDQIKRADGSSPTVLFLRAFSTGVRAKGSDSMTGEMLKELGCSNIADSEGTLLDDLSMEAIIMADPDYIFVTTMGESEEAAMDMIDELLITNPAWSELKAVKANHYYVLPKELFHNKPNKRWGESYRILADYLYGEK